MCTNTVLKWLTGGEEGARRERERMWLQQLASRSEVTFTRCCWWSVSGPSSDDNEARRGAEEGEGGRRRGCDWKQDWICVKFPYSWASSDSRLVYTNGRAQCLATINKDTLINRDTFTVPNTMFVYLQTPRTLDYNRDTIFCPVGIKILLQEGVDLWRKTHHILEV